MSRPKVDTHNMNVKLVIAGLAGMVDDDGMTAREALSLLDEIKNQTWSALVQMENEKKVGNE
jgi:hypothetical protein